MAAHTERIIMETFQQMLEEMPFYKISVSALVKRCGISPNTFYYHYQDIYALLRECQAHSKLVEHILNYLSREQIEQALFAADDNDLFYNFVKKTAGRREIPEAKLWSIADFCRYASIGFFLKGFWSHEQYDVDQLVDDLDRYIRCFVRAALEDETLPVDINN